MFLPALPSASSSLSSPTATGSVVTEPAKQELATWQPAVYLIVVLVIVGFIVGTILLIWNDDWTKLRKLTCWRRVKMEPTRPNSQSAFLLLPSASTLVQKMLRYFFTTLFPAFQHLRRATAVTVLPARPQQPALLLPLFTPPGFREPVLAAPRPAMPRDSSSFRVQSNPYSGSEPSSLPASPFPSPSHPAFIRNGSGGSSAQ